jgi:C4-dicarboxylate-binding protein DctP
MMLTRRLAAAAVALFLAAAPAAAQTRIDLAVFHTEADAFSAASRHWAERLAARTENRVQIRPHYASSLVRLTETLAATRDGIVPLGTTAAGVLSGQVPAMAFIEVIGGMPGDAEGFTRAAGPLHAELRRIFERQGVEYLWMQPAFGGLVACRDGHLRTPADWRGKRIRTAGRWQSQQMLALGAVPVTIDPAEQYIALRQGTVDCVLSNNTLALGLRLHEVAPYITQLRLPVNIVIYLGDPRAIARLPEADRTALRETGLEAQAFSVTHLLSQQDAAGNAMRQAGARVHTLSDEELAAFRAAVRPVYDAIAQAAGEAGRPIETALRPNW